jgi:hypothetical protein
MTARSRSLRGYGQPADCSGLSAQRERFFFAGEEKQHGYRLQGSTRESRQDRRRDACVARWRGNGWPGSHLGGTGPIRSALHRSGARRAVRLALSYARRPSASASDRSDDRVPATAPRDRSDCQYAPPSSPRLHSSPTPMLAQFMYTTTPAGNSDCTRRMEWTIRSSPRSGILRGYLVLRWNQLRPRQRDQDQPKHDDEPGTGRVLAPWPPRQSSERLDAPNVVSRSPEAWGQGHGRLSSSITRVLVVEHDAATRTVLFTRSSRRLPSIGAFCRACPPYRGARSKGKTENGVDYVKRNSSASRA